MKTSTITSKGQTTIPKVIREFLGVQPHQRIAYAIEEDRVVIRSVGSSVDDLFGSLHSKRKSAAKVEERAAFYKARAKRYQTGKR